VGKKNEGVGPAGTRNEGKLQFEKGIQLYTKDGLPSFRGRGSGKLTFAGLEQGKVIPA